MITEETRARYPDFCQAAEVELRMRGTGYNEYTVINNPKGLSEDELALICDSGNVPFGYRASGNIIRIYTD